jgi:Tol biopolymer transport system component
LAQSSGDYLRAYDWSPDDKRVVYCDFSANTVSTLWLIDVAWGAKILLSPKQSTQELYDNPQFSKDGKGIYVITDHDSEMRRLAYHICFSGRPVTRLKKKFQWAAEH